MKLQHAKQGDLNPVRAKSWDVTSTIDRGLDCVRAGKLPDAHT